MSIKFYFLSLRAFTHTSFVSISILNTLVSVQSPGGGEYSWEFLVGLCRLVIRILTLFQTKKCHFPHPFLDLEVVTKHNICVYLDRNYVTTAEFRMPTKGFLSFFLSFSFIIEITNTFIHYPWFLSKPYPIPDQNSAKTILFGAAPTYMAYIRESPPYPPGPKLSCLLVSPC